MEGVPSPFDMFKYRTSAYDRMLKLYRKYIYIQKYMWFLLPDDHHLSMQSIRLKRFYIHFAAYLKCGALFDVVCGTLFGVVYQ